MAKITFLGNNLNTVGELPEIGKKAPDFTLSRNDLSDVSLKDYLGKWIVLNIFPSVDTPVCATSVKTFHKEIIKLSKNAIVLNISLDLPFAQTRFCAAEGLERVETLSCFRSTFADDYGVTIQEGPLRGLCSRAVVILNDQGVVIYVEQVPELSQPPNYEEALRVFKERVSE
ncbi:MAG: thiol peroxidase [Chlamydiales bacterium]